MNARADGLALRTGEPDTPIWSLLTPASQAGLRFRRGDRLEVTLGNDLPVPVALIAMMAVLLVLVPRQVDRDAQETAIESALQTIAHFRSVRDYYNTAVIPKIRDSQGALQARPMAPGAGEEQQAAVEASQRRHGAAL